MECWLSNNLKKIVNNALGIADEYNSYHLYENRGGYSFTIYMEHEQITFEKLSKISEELCTKKINFHGISHTEGCNTCGHGEKTTVTIKVEFDNIPEVMEKIFPLKKVLL